MKKSNDRESNSLTSEKLGNWKVKRTGSNVIQLTLPEGMTLLGDDLTIEDIVKANEYFQQIKIELLACCSGNLAIA